MRSFFFHIGQIWNVDDVFKYVLYFSGLNPNVTVMMDLGALTVHKLTSMNANIGLVLYMLSVQIPWAVSNVLVAKDLLEMALCVNLLFECHMKKMKC